MTDQSPPHNLEAEKLLLGGLLCDPREFEQCLDILEGKDFYGLAYQKLWEEMVWAAAEDRPFDIITPDDLMLVDLKVNAPVGTGLIRYAKVVKEESYKRQVCVLAQEAQKRAGNGITATELLNSLSGDLAQIRSQEPSEAIPMDVAMAGALEHVEAVISGERERIGRSTGFESLDHYLGGLVPGGLYLIAARPSLGKTAMSLSMALRAATGDEKPIYVASMEMSRDELALRLLSQQSHISLAKIRTGRIPRADQYGAYDYLTAGDFEALARAAAEIAAMPILIDDTAHVSPSSLRSRVKQLNTKKELGLIVVDYVQLMIGDRKEMDDYQRVSEASRYLKLLAKEFNVPVIALSQLNRECEKRGDKRPQLSDLRESGNLEQDADAVMFIYRPAYYGLRDMAADYAEIIIAKQRNGPCGAVPLTWEAEYARFK